MSGIVYMLKNEAMPGIVKIGKTSRSDPNIRISELYTTGVPLPFECVIAMTVDDEQAVESALHTAFGPSRVNPRREFFEIEAEQAEAVLRLVGLEDVTPAINRDNESIPLEERRSADELRKSRRPRMNFQEMGIPIGAHLQAVDSDLVAVVSSPHRVTVDGTDMSLSEATRLSRGVDYKVQPGPFWYYDGKRLRDIYEETYGPAD